MDGKMREKNSQRHRFNWLDALILLALVFLAALAVIKFIPGGTDVSLTNEKKVTIEYTVQIDKLDTDLSLALKSGDAVVDIDSKVNVGMLASIPLSSAYQESIYNEQSGGMEIVNSEKYMTVYLTVVADAVETEYGYYVNNTRIAVESEMSLRIAGLEAEGKCISIKVNSADR